MNLYQEFNKIVNNYSYFEDSIKKILGIFEGTGENQIITSEIIPSNFRIKDSIVLSDQIERGLNIIHKGLRDIQEENAINSGSLFYFSQYGGSKTQFLNLIKNEASTRLNNCIVVLFEDLHHINPILIFESIFDQIFHIIAKMPELQENTEKYRKFSRELRQYLSEVQIAIRQSSNLKEAEEILKTLIKIKNPNMRQEIIKLDVLLHSTILVDPVAIFNKIISLMQFCSRNGISFLFLFDEVDLWLEEQGDDLSFSKDFNRKSKIMKYMLEIPDNQIKSYMVFACTDRVNMLFKTLQHKFENISPVSSRLNRHYNHAEKILEPGNYGPKIDEALVKIAAFYHLANKRVKIESHFLEEVLPVLEKKYKFLSRRMANSKILQILNNYQLISQPLAIGLKEWKSSATYYGNLIQKHLPSILNRLTIKFVREDVPIDPIKGLTKDKIDGYFVNYSLSNEKIKTYAEIKLTNNFKGDKAYQVLQYLQLNEDKHIILIIFCPMDLEKIKKEIYEYAENNGYSPKIYERLQFIHIKKPIAFAPVYGITKVSSDADKLFGYLDAFANWLEFFGDFSSQYQDIKQKIGIDFIPPEPTKPPAGPEDGQGEGPGIKPPEPKVTLNTEQRTCLNLLSQLYHNRKFTDSGRIYKSTIRKFIEKHSLGISDLEKHLEIMKKSNIINKITAKTLTFSEKIINTRSLDDLREITTNYFQKNEENTGLLTFS